MVAGEMRVLGSDATGSKNKTAFTVLPLGTLKSSTQGKFVLETERN